MSYSLIDENVQPACHGKNAYRRFSKVMTGHRSYQPTTGRCTSRDPLGDETFFITFTKGKPRSTVNQLRKESFEPVYIFVGNSPLDMTCPHAL